MTMRHRYSDMLVWVVAAVLAAGSLVFALVQTG